ncbi:MAG: tRNA (guanosine(37)-N1)-methyltransferase TrmD [Deinococcus sp.]|nr:tRNA (guanosine(37)-N1)-methyltransferase TrmD [Deinococcus sp.]MCL5965231.1 tRNA (guanosine(37)-N1)-methyltransferase TrmD [Deinococcus sp.]
MRYSILTLFPDLVLPWTREAILGKAIESGLISVDVRDIRDFSTDKHRTVDDAPYGGGAGMVMRVDVVVNAIESTLPADEVILLSPSGALFNQKLAEELSTKKHLALVSGRYEGIDARVEKYVTREVSLGDYVLMGGELGALAVLEATARLIPGVIGDPESHQRDSFTSGLLDYPHFTRPPEFRGQCVPEVLISGHHAKIAEWRRREALKRTWKQRPELLAAAELSPQDQRWLNEFDSGES